MISKFSNLTQRIITGVIGGGILISLLLLHSYSFLLAIVVLANGCAWEFFSLVRKAGYRPISWFGLIVGTISIFFFAFQVNLETYFDVTFLACVTLVFILKLFDKKDKMPFQSIGLTLVGLFYIYPSFSFLVTFHQESERRVLVLGFLLLLWANDTGAYFSGKKWGKTKLFERISPKKTWEGFFGGMISAVLVGGILSSWIKLPYFVFPTIGLLVSIFGTLGDLVESQFKRSLDIKDSGSVLAGHGGFLDRFDGLFVSVPVIAFLVIQYLKVVINFN